MIKGLIWVEYIIIINIYAPNIGALLYIREILTIIKGEINSNTVIVGVFNTRLTPMERSSRHKKINKEIQALNYTLDELDLVVTYR